MKLAHIADPHLGARQYHRQTPAGINQREDDVARAFRATIDGVIAARPDVVVIAGDLFHSVRPTNAAIVFAFRQFLRLREALPEAPVVLIAGNHDTPRSTETGTILRLFEEAGVDVAWDLTRRLVYPSLDLSVLAAPHQALVSGERPAFRPEGGERYHVLLLHGLFEGLLPEAAHAAEYGGALIGLGEIAPDQWSYVALGHYHVQQELAPRVWYAGSLEYVGMNIWGQLALEADRGIVGKGWLLVDLDAGTVTRQPVPAARQILDLEPVNAEGLLASAVNDLVVGRLKAVAGGIADKIIRLQVREIPRHVARELDHAAIRAYKAEALHLNLDLRRPEAHRLVGVGAPGRRQTLPELVRDYLTRRPLPAELDREVFVRTGVDLIDAIEREAAGS